MRHEEYKTIYRRDASRRRHFARREHGGIGKRVLAILAVVILVMATAFFGYTAKYYHNDEIANAILKDENSFIIDNGGYLKLPGNAEGDLYDPFEAVIFYPGGKVEYTSYLPLLKQLQDRGITCFLIKMPFNLAFFDMDAAEKVINENSQYTTWDLIGHSLGGVAASSYFADNEETFDKVVLLGSYIYGDVESRDKVLLIYGTEDINLDLSQIRQTDNKVVIEGGNHCQFGNYGFQKGDGEASISREEQQNIAANSIMEWIM